MTEELFLDEEYNSVEEAEFSIGVAFRFKLLDGLPRHLLIQESFGVLPRVEIEERDELLSSPSSIGASIDVAIHLAEVGLTPLDIFHAIDSVGYLICRLIENKLIHRKSVIVISALSVLINERESSVLTVDMLIDEIERSLQHCDNKVQVARELYKWLLGVGKYRNYIFSGHGFRCQAWSEDEEAPALVISLLKIENISLRWS